MAQTWGPTFSMPASATLAALQYHCVTMDTNGRIKQATDADVVLEPLFILMNKPTAIDQSAELALPGTIAKVVCGGNIDEGASVTTDGDGHGIATSTDGDWCVGIALEAGAVTEIIRILVTLGPYYITE